MTKRRVWWTIMMPGGHLDIEDNRPYHKLVLFETKSDAEQDVGVLEPGAKVVKIRIDVGD